MSLQFCYQSRVFRNLNMAITLTYHLRSFKRFDWNACIDIHLFNGFSHLLKDSFTIYRSSLCFKNSLDPESGQ